jgi:hypothetical protein
VTNVLGIDQGASALSRRAVRAVVAAEAGPRTDLAGAARYVVPGLRTCGLLDGDVVVVLSGGVMEIRCPVLRESIRSVLAGECPRGGRAVWAGGGSCLAGVGGGPGGVLGDETLPAVSLTSQRLGLLRTVG